MKHLLTALLICLGTTLFAQSSTTIDVTINGQTSREQLAQMRRDLQAQGIFFNYSPRFDNERRLVAIQYKVSTNDQVLLGEGGHADLQHAGANVTFHVNASSKTFAEEKDVVKK